MTQIPGENQDLFAQDLTVDELDNQVAAGFTNSAGVNGDKLHTLQRFAVLVAQHGMHWVNLGLPPGWLNVLVGPASEIGDMLVEDERVKAITGTKVIR